MVTRVAPRLTHSRFFIPSMWTRPASLTSVALEVENFRFVIVAIWDKPWSVIRLPASVRFSSRGSAWRWTRQASVKGTKSWSNERAVTVQTLQIQLGQEVEPAQRSQPLVGDPIVFGKIEADHAMQFR